MLTTKACKIESIRSLLKDCRRFLLLFCKIEERNKISDMKQRRNFKIPCFGSGSVVPSCSSEGNGRSAALLQKYARLVTGKRCLYLLRFKRDHNIEHMRAAMIEILVRRLQSRRYLTCLARRNEQQHACNPCSGKEGA